MRKFTLSASLAGLFSLTALFSAAPAQQVQNRIAAIQADAPRADLTHTVNPRARLAADLGVLPATTPVQAMTLRFSLTAAQENALEALQAAQGNPASPGYHQWLTPQQYGAQFGLSDADLQTVSAWLAAQGFTAIKPAVSRSFVTFSGTAAQVQAAFQTPLHQLSVAGETHFSNLQDATLPAALAGVVSSVTGLDDFRLKSRAHVHAEPAPQFTLSISGSHFIAPGDFYTIYDLNPQLTNSINGSGITIAVMGQTDISLADAAAFRTASGLPANAPTVQLFGADPGVPSTSDLEEAMLDVEWSGAVAPSASILFVNSTDVIAGSLTQAIDNNLAPIITISYGNCEAGFGTANLAVFNQLLRQATVQGQTVFGPAGDSGAADCDNGVASAADGLAVDFPASSPFVTAVGGTMFNENGGTYFSATNGTNSGSALSYIPEAVWNETTATSGIAAGGGGVSVVFTKPSYQAGTGVPNDGFRDVPDLAFNAAARHDGYLICAQGSCTNGYRNAAGNLNVVGGTSVPTPAMAGIMALLEQKINTRVGNANPTIYALANSNFYSTVFHDVTVGTNAVPCSAGSVGCPSGGTIGYPATTGYDQATGWGSLDVNNFINDWTVVALSSNTIASTFAPTTTTATVSAASVTAGTNVTFQVTVKGSLASVPTGNVQLVVDGSNIIATGALVAGQVTLTLPTTSLTSGAHSVTVLYLGDSVFAGSTTILNQNVINSTAADFTLTPATATITTKSGTASAGLTFTVAPVNGFTGTVVFTASSAATNLSAGYTFAPQSLTISGTASGTTVFTLQAYTTQLKTGTGLVRAGSGQQASLTAPGGLSGSGWKLAGGGMAMAGLLLFCIPGKRRRITGLLVAVVSVGLLATSGCSGTSTPFSALGTTNTVPGTYSILVTATSTSAAGAVTAHNATVTFVVQ